VSVDNDGCWIGIKNRGRFEGLLDLRYEAFFAIGAYTSAASETAAHGTLATRTLAVILPGTAGAILGDPTLSCTRSGLPRHRDAGVGEMPA